MALIASEREDKSHSDMCSIMIKASWDNGEKVTLEMSNLSPDTIAELIPWLREKRIGHMKGDQADDQD